MAVERDEANPVRAVKSPRSNVAAVDQILPPIVTNESMFARGVPPTAAVRATLTEPILPPAGEAVGSASAMAVSQCAEKLSRAMGLEHVRDPKGRSVRKYYAARIRENGQLVMKWDDLNADRPFMEVAAANRRNQVLGQCWQLKQDIDSFNERRCPDEPIQMDFNFNVDLEELGQVPETA